MKSILCQNFDRYAIITPMKKSPQQPKISEVNAFASSRLFTIEQFAITYSNGEQRQYERIRAKHQQAVLVVPILNEELLLIREYCAGIEQYTLGFAKGAMDAGEDILATANRELQEEVGFKAEKLSLLKTVAISPGYMTSTMHLVLAEDLTPSSLPGDEPEPLEVVKWPLARAKALLTHPDFCEGRNMAALALVLQAIEARA